MTETVWLSVAPQKTELTSFYQMDDRSAPPLERTKNMMVNLGGGHLDPKFLPQRQSTPTTGRKSLVIFSE